MQSNCKGSRNFSQAQRYVFIDLFKGFFLSTIQIYIPLPAYLFCVLLDP